MIPDIYRNWKATAFFKAAQENDSTVRGLVASGLMLGTRQGSGHPKYDVVDLARLELLRRLRDDMKVQGARAIRIVNALSDTLVTVTAEIFEETVSTGRYNWAGAPWAVIGDESATQEFAMLVAYSKSELGECFPEDAPEWGMPHAFFLVIQLRQCILSARIMADRIISGEIASKSE